MRNCHIFNGGPSADVFWRAVLTGWALDGRTAPFILLEDLKAALFIHSFIYKDFFFRMESSNSDTLSWSHGWTPSNEPQRTVALQSEVKTRKKTASLYSKLPLFYCLLAPNAAAALNTCRGDGGEARTLIRLIGTSIYIH